MVYSVWFRVGYLDLSQSETHGRGHSEPRPEKDLQLLMLQSPVLGRDNLLREGRGLPLQLDPCSARLVEELEFNITQSNINMK